jgi:hypothetical protein
MIDNKETIEGQIVSIGQWHVTKTGDRIRDFFVEADGRRTQYYCLTEFCERMKDEKALALGDFYRFEGCVNGLKIAVEDGREIHVNKIMVTKLWKPG